MPVARPKADREAVRTLAVAVGVREAARQLNIPVATVQAWSARGKWSEAISQAQAKVIPRVQPNATKPADALANALSDRHNQTKLGLSKYTMDAAKKAAKSNGKLGIAGQVLNVANIMAKVWPEQTSNAGNGLNLNILTGSASFQFEEGKEQ